MGPMRTVACPACKAEIPEDAMECPKCGADTEPPTMRPSSKRLPVAAPVASPDDAVTNPHDKTVDDDD